MNEIEKQPESKRGNPAWVKGVSGNPDGRPKKEFSIRTCLKEIGEKRAKGLSPKEKAMLKPFGYQAGWTNEQVFAAQIWARVRRDDEFGMKMAAEYTVGRPVPLTDMPTVIVNQQTVVEQKQEASIDKLATAFKAMVAAGIVPAEMFAGYAVTQGNGHINGHDDESA